MFVEIVVGIVFVISVDGGIMIVVVANVAADVDVTVFDVAVGDVVVMVKDVCCCGHCGLLGLLLLQIL